MPQSDRIILTDVDGVLLEWEDHFSKWMATKGFPQLENTEHEYDMSIRYGIHKDLSRELIREFNKSAWMSTQQPMPDAQTWIKLLHAEGWTFIPITSQTSDIPAQELRKRRLAELFGDTVFTNFFILETGDHKDAALAEFHGTGLWWVEDKPENADLGYRLGLQSILMEHGHNMNHECPYPVVKNWREIYAIITS